ncbi:MAG: hypothetical protein ACRD4M_07760 [Candidatus Acidiferrales bacterium]
MRILAATALTLILFPAPGWAQSKTQRTAHGSAKTARTDADRLELSCAQILKMTSAEWVDHFVDHFAPGADTVAATTERAIGVYGKCYDARTDRLAAILRRSGKGPLMGAMGNFRDFQQGLQNFTAMALADSQPAQPGPQDAQKLELKTAYAALYQKQFRYAFYRGYEKPPRKPATEPKTAPAKSAASRENPSEPLGVSPGGAASETKESPKSAPAAASSSAVAASGQDDAVNFSKAKNYFGELIGALPEDKSHPVHAAFGAIFGVNQVSEETRLAVYLYAIFLLEPTSDKPFAPPPF